MDREKFRPLFDPFHRPVTLRRGRPVWVSVLLAWIGIFGLSLSLTFLYVSMRGIMRLGGMVASGGPYAIEHPMPRYGYLVPVSIWVGLICVFIYYIAVKGMGGLNLAPLDWPALFISLGWNFLDFAFHPPGDGGLVWGWLVCGIVFWLMGLVPLLFIILYARQRYRENRLNSKFNKDLAQDQARRRGVDLFVLIELALVGLGIYLAALFFASLTKA